MESIPITHLYVRDGRFQSAGPVDQPVAPVDESHVVHPDERFPDSLLTFLLHGECSPTPVIRAAYPPQLVVYPLSFPTVMIPQLTLVSPALSSSHFQQGHKRRAVSKGAAGMVSNKQATR